MTTEITRKEFVKQQREKFIKSPKQFFKEEYLDDFIYGIKNNLSSNIFSFIKWIFIYFIIISLIAFVSFEYITCTGNDEKYNGSFYDVYPTFKQDLEYSKLYLDNNNIVKNKPQIICLYDNQRLKNHFFTALELIKG